MTAELAALSTKKETLLAVYKTARSEEQEYETVKQNVEALLLRSVSNQKQKTKEIE